MTTTRKSPARPVRFSSARRLTQRSQYPPTALSWAAFHRGRMSSIFSSGHTRFRAAGRISHILRTLPIPARARSQILGSITLKLDERAALANVAEIVLGALLPYTPEPKTVAVVLSHVNELPSLKAAATDFLLAPVAPLPFTAARITKDLIGMATDPMQRA